MLGLTVDNIPVIFGVAVAVLSFLSSLIKFFNEQNIGIKVTKRAKEYADIYSSLPDGIDAKTDVAKLLKLETEQLLERRLRKINYGNVAAVIIVALVGGGLSYLLALWATNSPTIIAVLAWILFTAVAFFTLGISITGLASVYQEPKRKNNRI